MCGCGCGCVSICVCALARALVLTAALVRACVCYVVCMRNDLPFAGAMTDFNARVVYAGTRRNISTGQPESFQVPNAANHYMPKCNQEQHAPPKSFSLPRNTRTRTHTHTHTHARTHTHAHVRTHALTHTQARTHAHTHTLTHAFHLHLPLGLSLSLDLSASALGWAVIISFWPCSAALTVPPHGRSRQRVAMLLLEEHKLWPPPHLHILA